MTNRAIIAAIAGGIVYFFLGYLFYGVLLGDYFKTHAGSASGVMRDAPDMLPLILGHIAIGFLYALIFSWWAAISTFRTGAIRGAWIGFLMALGMNLISLGTAHINTMNSALVNAVLGAIMGAVVGGVVGHVLGQKGVFLGTRPR